VVVAVVLVRERRDGVEVVVVVAGVVVVLDEDVE